MFKHVLLFTSREAHAAHQFPLVKLCPSLEESRKNILRDSKGNAQCVVLVQPYATQKTITLRLKVARSIFTLQIYSPCILNCQSFHDHGLYIKMGGVTVTEFGFTVSAWCFRFDCPWLFRCTRWHCHRYYTALNLCLDWQAATCQSNSNDADNFMVIFTWNWTKTDKMDWWIYLMN